MAESRITPRTVYVGIGLFVALLVGLYFVYWIYEILLLFLLTVLFSVALDVPVSYLARRGVPRTLGVLAVIGALVGVVWLFVVLFASTVREQALQLAESLPELLEETMALIERVQGFFGLDLPVGADPQSLMEAAGDFLARGGMLEAAAGVGMTVATVVSLGAVMLIAVLYLVVRPRAWVEGFVSLFPANRRQRVREVLEKLYRTLQRWLVGQLAAMTFIGVATAVALSIIGVPFALLLGLFAGLISFVPFLGAIVSAIPPILLALVEDPILAVWVVVAYTAIQQVESNVIQPVVMSRAVRLHPALVLFAIIVMGTLFGVVGVLLAVPLVAVVQVLVHELWVKRMDQVGDDPGPPRGKEDSQELVRALRKALRKLRAR